MKICSYCSVKKDLSQFAIRDLVKGTRRSKCKECDAVRNKVLHDLNKEENNRISKEYYKNNKEKCAAQALIYRNSHKSEIALCNKKYRSDNSEELKAKGIEKRAKPENKAKIVERNAKNRDMINKSHHLYMAKRTAEDPMFLKARQMRADMSRTFQRAIAGTAKFDRYSDILGCTIGHWFNHITSQFKPGMSLEDRSSFQLDHIQPISSATDEESLIKLHHWTNYQPLFKAENAKKGKKIIASLVVKSRVKKLNIDSNNYISI